MKHNLEYSRASLKRIRLKRISGYNEVFLRNGSFPIGLHTCNLYCAHREVVYCEIRLLRTTF